MDGNFYPYPDAKQAIPSQERGNPMKTGNAEKGFKDSATVPAEVISLRALGMPPSCSSSGPSPFMVWDGTHPRIAMSEVPAVASTVSYPVKSENKPVLKSENPSLFPGLFSVFCPSCSVFLARVICHDLPKRSKNCPRRPLSNDLGQKRPLSILTCACDII